jgi:hypothetical protein
MEKKRPLTLTPQSKQKLVKTDCRPNLKHKAIAILEQRRKSL